MDDRMADQGFTRREVLTTGAKLAAGSAALWAVGASTTSVQAAGTTAKTTEVFGPPYDFTDEFYRRNGVDPSKIVMRVNGSPPSSTTARRTDPFPGFSFASDTDPKFNRHVRVLETTGGYDNEGNIEYYWVDGMLLADAFTSDAAGRQARELADTFFAYLFPKASGDPFGLDVTNRRQDNVFGDPDPFYDFDALGLWTAAFVSYTQLALTTGPGRQVLADLAKKNGRDLDGTPIIKTVDEIDFLHGRGLVQLRSRPADGSLGPPWVI
jgi:hypothetical protein